VVARNRDDSKSVQPKRFIDAARALECDESEECFDAALKKVAAHKTPHKEPPHKRDKDKGTEK
jgi:hypothetical protein